MLSPEEKKEIVKAASRMGDPVSLLVNVPQGDESFGGELLRFAREVGEASSRSLRVEEAGAAVVPGKASLTIGAAASSNIHYLAMPTGREFAPFLDALLWLGKAVEPPDTPALGSLSGVIRPSRAMVFITPSCPHCPLVVRAAISLAVRLPAFSVTVVDALRHEDLAARFRVKATPTLIIDETATLVGEVTVEDLARHLLRASSGDSLTEALRSMIGAGRAEDAARLISREKRPGDLMPLYLAKDFSTRMGALLVMEEALALDPRALDPLLSRLIELLSHEDAAVRGDTAALLGKIGDPGATQGLRKVLEDSDPDVREAAREALDLLEGGT
jgi:alkyl hydroperoxide reductase subunit AhpF